VGDGLRRLRPANDVKKCGWSIGRLVDGACRKRTEDSDLRTVLETGGLIKRYLGRLMDGGVSGGKHAWSCDEEGTYEGVSDDDGLEIIRGGDVHPRLRLSVHPLFLYSKAQRTERSGDVTLGSVSFQLGLFSLERGKIGL